MRGVSRRQTLAGLVALAASPARGGETNDDDRLRGALDTLPAHDPLAALAVLARFDPARLSLSPRLDLLTVRAGLEIDRRLAALGDDNTLSELPANSRALHYELLLARRLGTITLDAARTRLAAALDRLTLRTDRALAAIGLREGGVGERLTQLVTDERYLYPDSDAGRNRAVADMNDRLAARRAQVSLAFADVPSWCLEVSVRRAGPGEVAGKRVLPAPGTPGSYVVDLRDIRRRPGWTLGSVVAHELLPGHMLQLPIEAAAFMHPSRADYATGFVEGWGIYAEQLAAEQGAFDGDLLGLVGHLHWLLFRVARASVDIGVHADGWSGDRARAFFERHQGPAAYFAPYEVEIRRLAAEPASRAADALAWLTIADFAPADWRHRRRFHAAVLRGGRKRREHIVSSTE